MPGPAFPIGESVDLHTFEEEEEDVAFVHGAVNDHRVWRSLDGQVTPTSLRSGDSSRARAATTTRSSSS